MADEAMTDAHPHSGVANNAEEDVVVRHPMDLFRLTSQHGGEVDSDGVVDYSVDVFVKHNHPFTGISARWLGELSTWFDNHLRDFWKKGLRREIVKIPTVEPAVFELFRDWIMQHTVFVGTRRPIELSYEHLFHTYVFGRNMGSPGFCNEIIDIVTAKFDAAHPPEPVLPTIAFKKTPEKSPLRRIIVDVHAYLGGPSLLKDPTVQHYSPPEFLNDLACKLYELRDQACRDKPFPFALATAGCAYHEHGLLGNPDCKGPNIQQLQSFRLSEGDDESVSRDGNHTTQAQHGVVCAPDIEDEQHSIPSGASQFPANLFVPSTPCRGRNREICLDSALGGMTDPMDSTSTNRTGMDITPDHESLGSLAPKRRSNGSSGNTQDTPCPARSQPEATIKSEPLAEETPSRPKRKPTAAEKSAKKQRVEEMQKHGKKLSDAIALDD